jgi:hypothetical protein
MSLKLPSKIDDESLQAFAESSDKTFRSVIVELAIPPIEVLRPWGKTPPRFEQAKSAKPSDRAADKKPLMDKLGRSLKRIAKDVVRIDAADAFVLSVSPEQLREIKEMPLVGSVRPNRAHFRPHAAGA